MAESYRVAVDDGEDEEVYANGCAQAVVRCLRLRKAEGTLHDNQGTNYRAYVYSCDDGNYMDEEEHIECCLGSDGDIHVVDPTHTVIVSWPQPRHGGSICATEMNVVAGDHRSAANEAVRQLDGKHHHAAQSNLSIATEVYNITCEEDPARTEMTVRCETQWLYYTE